MLAALQFSLSDAEKIVGSPLALAVVLVIGALLLIGVWRSLAKHQQNCVTASTNVASILAGQNTTQALQTAALTRIESSLGGLNDKIDKHADRIAKLEGRLGE